ncbi:NTE family protein [Crossiella equi]|uniref:NTE family protein n=1 Tax=Crossiella equi TaxID=130796 RepID=A0ABS5A5A2_9PSEU|nr:patatin-like phospholipase family protein [Crossiella equi]MBP2471422.1 NTE family protein [Crossiella equi]
MRDHGLPTPVGFVLGGGGSLGAIQVGMLRALAEHGITPDLVVGTSVGSVNGALLALDPEHAAGRLGKLWQLMTRQRVFPGGPIRQLRTLRRSRNHLFSSDGLAEVLDQGLGGITSFDQLSVPFGAVAVDAVTAQPVVLTEGELVPAVLASAAIPGIYPPVRIGEHVLYDGGVLANVPVSQALAMGAKSLVVLDCAFPGHLPGVPASLPETLLFWATLATRNQAVLEATRWAEHAPIVYLPGAPARPVTPLDFRFTGELMDRSYQESVDFLAGLHVTGPGLYGHPAGPSPSTP